MIDTSFAQYYNQIDECLGVRVLHAPTLLIETLMKGKDYR